MKKDKFKCINRILFGIFIILMIGLLIIILFIILDLEPDSFFSFLPQLLLVLITTVYVFETHRIANKTAKSVEATEKLIEITLKPQEAKRKSIAKNLLFEIHDNNNSLREIKGRINEMEKTKTRFDPIFYSDFFFSTYSVFIEKYLDSDFSDENLIPFVRTYYSYLNQIKNAIKEYNLNAGSKYSEKTKPFSYFEIIFKIPIVCKFGDRLFNLLETESGFNYSEKEYFYKYKPFKLED